MAVLLVSDIDGLLDCEEISIDGTVFKVIKKPANLGGIICFLACPKCGKPCRKFYDLLCRYCSGVQGLKPPKTRWRLIAWHLDQAQSNRLNRLFHLTKAKHLMQLESRKIANR